MGFVTSSQSLTEPGTVEVGVRLFGSLSIPVIILVEVNPTSASGTNFNTVGVLVTVCVILLHQI